MRTAFIQSLTEVARKNSNVMLLTGDLGYSVFETFAAEMPSQFLNCGVAEQNMMGVAAGLAKAGKKPFVYSIIPFVTLRCLEQIRNDFCYHNLGVTVVGIGAGYSYGALGATHHAIEDLAVTRAIPDLTVIAPGDPMEVEAAVYALASHPKPAYLRLGKRGDPPVHTVPINNFRLGFGLILRTGTDVALVSTSNMLPTAMTVADQLTTQQNISVTVVSLHTLKPVDTALIEKLASKNRRIYTLEEHSIIGGLGSAVCEIVAGLPQPRARVIRLGVPDVFQHLAGSQAHYRKLVSLDPDSIVKRILAEGNNL